MHANVKENGNNRIVIVGFFLAELSTLNSPVEDADAVEKDDDEAGLHISASGSDESRPAVAPRWPTRVFAIDCLLKIIAVCDSSANVDVHFDLVMARVAKEQGKGMWIVVISEVNSVINYLCYPNQLKLVIIASE